MIVRFDKYVNCEAIFDNDIVIGRYYNKLLRLNSTVMPFGAGSLNH